MDVFGSREGDPLLQDDPFAPSDEETDDASDSAPPQSADASEQASAPDGSAEQLEAEKNTVFDSLPTASAMEGEDATRVIVRSAEAAAEGRLTELNAAFDQGWRLAHVDLRSETADAPSPEGHSFAFVLRGGPHSG